MLAAAAVAAAGVAGVVFLAHNVSGDHANASTHEVAHEAPASAASSTTAVAVPKLANSALPQAAHSVAGAADAAAQLTAIDAGESSGAISVSATNVATGATFTWGATNGMTTASVAKLDTLETMLLLHQQSGQALDEDEASEASAMIEDSDNDAADWLWNDVGGDSAVTAANKTFGLTSTVVGTDGYWGLSTTSAADQVALLKQLVGATTLTPSSQSYALGLMRAVDPDQAWGVSAVADPGTATALKNGWLAVSDDDDLWTVNSVGLVSVHGQQIALAVMTQHQIDEPTGIDLVERLASATVTAVTS